MIPRFEPQLGWREFFALLAPAYPQAVERFETAFAEAMGQKHAIGFYKAKSVGCCVAEIEIVR